MITNGRLPPFKPELRQAIREGRKKVTRRVVKPQPDNSSSSTYDRHGHILTHINFGWSWQRPTISGSRVPVGDDYMLRCCPYGQPGDIRHMIEPLRMRQGVATYADDGLIAHGHNLCPMPWRWSKPTLSSIHMPTEAARIFVRITEIRVERVQEITYQEAVAEGVQHPAMIPGRAGAPEGSMVGGFAHLWQSINGKRPGCSWEDNPWVWVVRWELLP